MMHATAMSGRARGGYNWLRDMLVCLVHISPGAVTALLALLG